MSIYQREHFDSVAAILLNFRDRFADTLEGANTYGWLVGRFISTFAISNSEFDTKLFENACGWTDYEDWLEKMKEQSATIHP